MTDQLTLGRLSRDLQRADITVRRADDGKRVTFSFPASSEAPVQRFFGTEVLRHDAQSIRTARIDGGAAPLLFNHDWSDPIGMVTGSRIEGGRLMVDAALFATARAAEIASMVEGGLRNVSIGYEIYEMTEDVKRAVYTATDWEPLEVSIVTVPADPSVGIGRQADDQAKPVRVVRAAEVSPPAATAASQRSIAVSEQTTVAAGVNAEPQTRVEVVADHSNRPTPVQLEQQRKQAILNLCRANKLDERYAQHWISHGTSLETVAEELLKVQAERQADQSATFLDMTKTEVARYSLLRALRAATSKDWSKAGLELEANREISKRMSRLPRSDTSFFVPLDKLLQEGRRDMTVAGVSGSNYLVSTTNMAGSFIDLLRASSVGLQMGVTRMAGLVGNVTIPRMTAGHTAYWLSDENTQITESQPTIGQVSLTPKNVAALTELSHQLMQQSSPDAEQMVLTSIARDIGLAVDVGIIRGSGTSGQPQGIVGTSGIGSVSGTSLDAADVIEFMTDVAGGNALSPASGYVTTPAVAGLLMARPELPSTGTTRMWLGNLVSGSLFGHRAMASTQMATATMLFGDWSTVVLAEWGVLELMVNPFSDFTRGLSQVRGWYTCDVAMRYPAAFSYASSIT